MTMDARQRWRLSYAAYRAGSMWAVKPDAYRTLVEGLLSRANAELDRNDYMLAKRCLPYKPAGMTFIEWANQRDSRWGQAIRHY